MQYLKQELEKHKRWVLGIAFVLLSSYSIFLFFDDATVSQLGEEDGFFEYLTAFFFLLAAVLFGLKARKPFNIFYVGLALLFFVGFGEEISWGQRILGLSTPESIARHNVQGEITLHNLEVLNSNNFDSTLKTGWQKLLTVNFLYKVFCVAFGVVLPLLVLLFESLNQLASKIKLPVPALVLGSFFLVNWFVFKVINSVLLPDGKSAQVYDTVGEISEFVSAFIFFAIAWALFKFGKSNTEKSST